MPRRKSSSEFKPKGRVIINPEIQFTDDDICRLLFGLNKEQLVKDICDNKGGRYDKLYVKEETV
jgi:hypothetical protein